MYQRKSGPPVLIELTRFKFSPAQMSGGFTTVGSGVICFTMYVTLARGPSQLCVPITCDTQWSNVPALPEEANGAMASEVPPTAVGYHLRFAPINEVTELLSKGGILPTQISAGLAMIGEGVKEGSIVYVTFTLRLSQTPTDCVTQLLNMPRFLVSAMGGVVLPVPPVAAVYHFTAVPVIAAAKFGEVPP